MDVILYDRFKERFIPVPESGCWLWTESLNKGGYGYLSQHLAHRLSYEHYKGSIPKGLYVLHTCDIPSCVNPEHLFLGTQSDNMQDMVAKRRYSKVSKLTSVQVQKIREGLLNGVSQKVLALEYGVRPSTISLIKLNKIWRQLVCQ